MTRADPSPAHRATAADAMVHFPKVCPPSATVAQVTELFRDDHVHCALIVDRGRLLAVVERSDLGHARPHTPARIVGRLPGRVTTPCADLEATLHAMTVQGRRRLAVIDEHSMLLGLLCLKRSGLGFCRDADVQARAAERANTLGLPAHGTQKRRQPAFPARGSGE
jgi:hypothetical protein